MDHEQWFDESFPKDIEPLPDHALRPNEVVAEEIRQLIERRRARREAARMQRSSPMYADMGMPDDMDAFGDSDPQTWRDEDFEAGQRSSRRPQACAQRSRQAEPLDEAHFQARGRVDRQTRSESNGPGQGQIQQSGIQLSALLARRLRLRDDGAQHETAARGSQGRDRPSNSWHDEDRNFGPPMQRAMRGDPRGFRAPDGREDRRRGFRGPPAWVEEDDYDDYYY